jgi:hypothetical protein
MVTPVGEKEIASDGLLVNALGTDCQCCCYLVYTVV